MSHRLTKEELDAQFEKFLKESVSDDSVDFGDPDKPSQTKSRWRSDQKAAVSRWPDDEQSNGAISGALPGSRKSFRKSLRTSQTVEEKEEELRDPGRRDEGLREPFLTRGSTETEESLMIPAVNRISLGLDTLEEEEEKARFFTQLEAEASSTVDYSKLNREMSSVSSSDLRNEEDTAVEQNKDDQVRVTGSVGDSAGSPHYSEDFEDEEDMKELWQEKPGMSPILARVSLYDSLDDTGGEDRRKDAGVSLDRGQSYAQSGGSEVEALQEVYRQIHTGADSDQPHYSSLEGTERIIRPSSPSSPPRHDQQSIQPASTIESDLPTAEELMRPIRPEDNQIRGFTLQPVRAPELKQGEKSQSLERTFPVVTESEPKGPGKTVPAAESKGVWGQKRHPSRSSDSPNHEPTWSIRKEVDRLMQDEKEYSSQTSSHTDKAQKRPVSCGSSASHASTYSERRPIVAPVRGRTVDGRAAVNKKSSRTIKAAASSKTHPSKPKSIKNQENDDRDSAEPGVKVSGELVASVQSLVAVLQQQIDSSSYQEALGPSQPPHLNSQEEVEHLRVRLAQKERELQVMKDGAEEITSLRQQNYLLQSKLRSVEEASQKKSWLEAEGPATDKKLEQVHKEIKEQETLIKGYQQENEKLYLQMKAQQTRSKANEEAMFNENQRLLSELAFTREQLSKASEPESGLMDHTQRISDLLAQISQLKRNEAKLSEDNRRLKQDKRSLEVDLQLMDQDRELAKAHLISSTGEKTLKLRELEEEHRQEVATLKKKLQWFAENQELLDRDAGRLKAATAEILQLKEQVEKLKQEVERRSSDRHKKARDRSVDTKHMQDLERQVKELEQILRNRNPNSLPALIYAAASAASDERVDSTKTSSGLNAVLERRIQGLEAELESHDEEAKRNLRAMEQQFHRIKLRYEQQIFELEQQLKRGQQAEAAAPSEPWRSKCQTLEEELQRVKEKHQDKERNLHEQIRLFQQQLRNKVQPSPGRHQRQAEAAFGARLERLNQELATKTRRIQELSCTVDRLQKERRNMLSAPNPQPEPPPTDTKQNPRQTKAHCSAAEETFPAAQYQKTYQPTVFTGSHISEVLQENQDLKQQIELLQLQSDQEKETLRTQAVQSEEELLRLKELHEEQLSLMKAEHLGILDRQRAAHALEHSSSKVAELTNNLNLQEMVVKHLKKQLNELQGFKEALRLSQSREAALEKQLTRLLQELKEAKEAQRSEVKLLWNLERKIMNMELRHQHREEELQQVIGGAWQMSAADLRSEVERWRCVAQDRSRELAAFRTELDSILDILRHLQKQGVVLTPPEASS